MGACCSCDNTPAAPEEIIPDPEFGESIQCTIEQAGWSGLSRDYQVFRSHEKPAEPNRMPPETPGPDIDPSDVPEEMPQQDPGGGGPGDSRPYGGQ